MSTGLHFHQVCKAYASKQLLQSCERQVDTGKKVAVLGSNGSGKTTLLRLVSGLVLPDSGEISWNGKATHQLDRKNFGWMASLGLLYPKISARQNLQLSGQLFAAESALDEAIAQWRLSDFIDSKVSSLSNGQRALLSLARATLHRPPLLLLDEPLAFLDSSHAQHVLRQLTDYAGTVLLTAQDNVVLDDWAQETWTL